LTHFSDLLIAEPLQGWLRPTFTGVAVARVRPCSPRSLEILLLGHDLKVFKAVIPLVAVNVVNLQAVRVAACFIRSKSQERDCHEDMNMHATLGAVAG